MFEYGYSMSDQRFSDRLKRIEARGRVGGPAELIAGVGDVTEAKEAVTGQSRGSIVLALFGALVGVWALHILKSQVGLNELLAYPPEMLLEIGTSEPLIGSAAAILSACLVLAVFSILRGRKSMKIMSFSLAAVGAAGGSVMMTAI